MQTTSISMFFSVLLVLALGTSKFQSCVARDTITFNSILPDDGTTLISAGKRFELGFFNPDGDVNSGRYVGIWYFNLRPRTVVWVANRNESLTDAPGYFGIDEHGNVNLLDDSGKSYFHTNLQSSNPVNRILKLLDSGNLALIYGTSGNYLWQSFAYPTDTFLPGMNMDESLQLVSWKDSGNPAAGNFTFQLDQESRSHKIFKGSTVVYWESDESDFVELPYYVAFFLSNFSHSVDQVTCKSSNANHLKKNPCASNDSAALATYSAALAFYSNTRMLMNSSGEIQFYRLEQDGWSLIWTEPHEFCSVYNPCGDFGSCSLKNVDSLNCKCLPGFKPRFPDAWKNGDFSSGCDRKFPICNKTSKPDTFLNLKSMKVGKHNTRFPGADNEDKCRNYCLSNCECLAYYHEELSKLNRTINDGAGCLIWTSVTNLQEDYIEDGYNLAIRVAVSSIESTSRDCQTCGTYAIPYPLSTRLDCGDPSYYSFSCDDSTDHLSFFNLNNSYEVININNDDRRFLIQVNGQKAENCSAKTSVGRVLQLTLPFYVINRCYNEPLTSGDGPSSQIRQIIEIGWNPPLEPLCNSTNDCKDWPDSNCTAIHEQKRCLCNSNYQWNNQALKCISATNQREKQSVSVIRVVVIIFTTVIALVLLAGSLCCFFYRRRFLAKRKESKQSINLVPYLDNSERQATDLVDEYDNTIDVPYFSLESILAATDNFSDTNKLGRGGFGPVYKGMFPGEKEIAVKRLLSHSGQGMEEFRNEVLLIAKLQHRNLVKLLGYCIKGSEKILLYEYMPNKSLDTFIFDQGRCILLDWNMRFKIILGIVRGLLYLHQDSRLRIIHRDMKASNILLDEEMNPKISDFGLARTVQDKETEANTLKVVGTYGYMSPEYAIEGLFSVKSDVFSFGVILLEIVSGKRNTTGFFQSEEALSLLGYAWRLWQQSKAMDLVDKKLLESCNGTEVMKCINIGLLCVQDDPSDRPTMSNVLIMLGSETTTLPSPKQPSFVARRRTSSTSSSLTSKAESNSINEMTISVEEGR